MKKIDLASEPLSSSELFDMAREDSLFVKTGEGDCFVVSQADELATEIELLRQNHTFLAMLDRFKEDKDTMPFSAVEKRLR